MAISYQRKLGDGTIVIDSGTSNVGIGTNDPGAKLEISDTTTGIGAIISNTTHNSRLQIYTIAVGKNSEIWFGDAADDDIGKIDYDHANNSLAFFTNASERMRIDSGGSVGIGTTNPNKRLSVETNDTATYSASVNASEISIARKNSSNTAGQVAAISLNATGWSGQTTGVVVLNAIARQGNFSNADFAIQNRVGGNFVETFRITTYGNVGIGTDTPDDNVNTGSYFKPDGGGRFLTVKDSSGSFIMLESSTTTDDDQIGGIYFNNTGGQADAHVHVAGIDAILHKHGTNDALSGGDLRFFTKPSGSGVNGPRMTILQDGNVGIGTTSPNYKLHVEGNVGITEYLQHSGDNNTYLRFSGDMIRLAAGGVEMIRLLEDATQDTLIINEPGADVDFRVESNTDTHALFVQGSDGNVGIGTDSPEQKLHVKASDTTAIIKIEGGNSVVTANGEINSRLEFGSNDGSVNSSGNVGGSIESVTENPNGAITGLAFSTFYQSRTPNDLAEAMRITGSGNVGIGTASPTNKLDVRGLTRLNALSLRGGADNYSHLSRFSWRDTNSSSSGSTWKKVCGVSIGTGNYSAVSVDVVHYYPGSNHGNSASLKKRHYSISFRRSSGTQDNEDDAIVYGRDANFIRVVRTALGEFELQARANANNQSYSVDITQTGGNSDAITMVENSSTNGNTTGTIYAAVSSANTVVSLPGSLGAGSNVYLNHSGHSYLNGGNVGIGTTTPDAPLTVHSSTDPEIRFGYSSTQDHRIQWDSSKVYIHADPENANASSALGLYVDGTSRLYIPDSGNVGIGTTSPGQKLQVEGAISAGTDNSTSGSLILVGKYSNGNIITIGGGYSAGGAVIGYGVKPSTTAAGAFLSSSALTNLERSAYVQHGSTHQWWTGAYQTAAVDSAATLSQVMTLDGSGNLGIGTTSPQSKLHVQSGAGIFNVSDDWQQSTYRTHLFRGGGFNSSISEDSTAVKIFNGSSTTGKSAGNYWGGIGFMHLDPEYGSWGTTYTGEHFWIGGRLIDTPQQERSALVFATNNVTTSGSHSSEKMVILPDGNVGIGTTSPTLALDVRGTQGSPSSSGTSQTGSLSIRGGGSHFMSSGMLNVSPWTGWFQAQDANNLATTYPLALNPNGGNVGIGTTSPGDKLHIKGGFRIEDGATTSNFRLNFSDANTLDFILEPSDDTTPNVFRFRGNSQNESAGLRVYDRYESDYISLRHNAANAFIETDSDSIYISPEGNQALKVEAGGNVGIGTTSPGYKLHVSGDAYSEKAFRLNKRIHYNFNGATFDGENTDGEGRRYTIGRVYYSKNHWGYYGTLRIQVNTRYPYNGTQTFLVQHSGDFAGIRCIEAHGSSAYLSNVKLELGSETDTGVDFSNYDVVYKDIYLYVDRYLQARVYAEVDAHAFEYDKTTVTSGEYYMTTLFTTTSNQDKTSVTGFSNYQTVEIVSNSNNKAYVAGNLGVGTASPSRRLHVSAGNTDIAAKFENTSNNSTVLHLQTTGDGKSMYFQTDHIYVSSGAMHFGNDTGDLYLKPGSSSGVGINTTNPTGLFNSYISAARQITHNGNGGDLSVISDNNSSPVFYVKGTGTADLVNVFDNTTEVFTIKDGGNVGIGTDSPGAKLTVKGADSINAFKVTDSGDGDGFKITSHQTQGTYIQAYNADHTQTIMLDARTDASNRHTYFNGGGNVGIGTTSPGAKLDVRMSDSNGTYGRGKDGNLNIENTNTSVTEGGWLSISGYMGNTTSQYQMGMITGGKDSAAADNNYAGHLSFWTTSGGANGEANSGGYERMRINGAGNVGIGTTSPSYKLDVNGTAHYTGNVLLDDNVELRLGTSSDFKAAHTGSYTYMYNYTGHMYLRNFADDSDIIFQTDDGAGGYTNYLVLDGSSTDAYFSNPGNVGIGTTAPQQALHIKGATNGLMMLEGDNDNGIAGCYYKTEDTDDTMNRTKGFFGFQGNNTWGLGYFTMWLDNVGDNGTVTASEERFRWERDGDFHADGDVIAYSTTTPSDIRLKTDIETIESASEKVSKLRGVEYTWSKGKLAGQREIGLIAQEVEAVVPEVVKEKKLPLWDDSGESYKTVDYDKLVALLIESNKEMQEEIKKLKERLDGFTK